MRRVMGAVLVAVLAGCGPDDDGGATAVASAATALPPLRVEDGFFRDPAGRAVILHGVNYSHRTKTLPFTAWQKREHFERMRAWGFNCVRYLVAWEAVMPSPGAIDAAYLDDVERAVRWAGECGLYVLVDMHQDLYARIFGGDGAPAWACVDGLVEPNDLWTPWFLNYFSPEVRASFDQFWSSVYLQERYAAAWTAVVGRVRDFPNVVGYDLMNEPFMGTALPWSFEAGALTSFYATLAARIRRSDPVRPVFVEPLAVTANNGLPSFMGRPCDNLVYAPHFYDPLQATGIGYLGGAQAALPWAAFSVHQNTARAWGTVMFLGEFGANDVAGLEAQLSALDALLVSGWTYWNYNPELATNGALETDVLSIVDTDGVERPVVDRLVRPYPLAVCGTPGLLSFDAATRAFRLAWTGPAGETVVRVPSRHYPGGVVVTGAPSWTIVGDTLTIAHGAGSFSVAVTPP